MSKAGYPCTELCRNIQNLEQRGIRVVKHMRVKDRIRMPDLHAPMLSQVMYEEAAKDIPAEALEYFSK